MQAIKQKCSEHQFVSLFLVTVLGFVSGFPLLLTGSTMQTWAVSKGLSLSDVGFLSIIGLPYLLKWVWAPLIDKVNFFAKSTLLIIVQFIICFSLIGMSLFANQIPYWQLFAVFVAFFSATQDLIIDAYRIELLSTENYGIGSALSSIGYRLGMIVAGGIGLILAENNGWQNTYMLAALIMLLMALCSAFMPKIKVKKMGVFSIREAFRDLLAKKNAYFWLMIVCFYRFSDVVVANLGGAFLIQYCNLSISEVGLIYKVAGVIATIFGSVIAGLVLKKYELRQMLMFGAMLQCIGFVPFFVLSNIKNFSFLWCYFVIAFESLCSGFAVTCVLALLMDWCNEKYLTTQFAWLSAIVAVPRICMGGFVGQFATSFGWSNLFLLMIIIAMIVVIMLAWINTKESKLL